MQVNALKMVPVLGLITLTHTHTHIHTHIHIHTHTHKTLAERALKISPNMTLINKSSQKVHKIRGEENQALFVQIVFF